MSILGATERQLVANLGFLLGLLAGSPDRVLLKFLFDIFDGGWGMMEIFVRDLCCSEPKTMFKVILCEHTSFFLFHSVSRTSNCTESTSVWLRQLLVATKAAPNCMMRMLITTAISEHQECEKTPISL